MSKRTKPETQLDEIAVKLAVIKSARCGPLVEIGNSKNIVPNAIKNKKLSTISFIGEILFSFSIDILKLYKKITPNISTSSYYIINRGILKYL